MSKVVENMRGNQKDIYSVWKDNIENFYSNIEKSIPQFHQATTNLFQEYVEAWSNIATSIIDIQKEYATKAGIKSNLPEVSMKVMHDTTEEINKSFSVQNKISIASIDAAKQNIKAWNDNSSAFADLNKSILDSMIYSVNPKT
jgi:hypothetical protein